MKKLLCLVLFVLLAACGGGGGDAPSAPKAKTVISFYGDSITSGGQVARIVRGDFIGLDYSVGGQHSDVPLNPADTASVVVIRYGMADVAHGLLPSQTRANVEKLVADVRRLGKRPIVVNVSWTPSGIELPVNAALQGLVDIDVSDLRGQLLDELHPDDAFYALLNDRIHDELVRKWVDGQDAAAAWATVRAERDALLKATDWTQLPDIPASTRAAWAPYRQALRDITGKADPFNIVWPVAPG